MDNSRNTIIFIVSSMFILLGWQYFIAGPRLEAERQAQEAARTAQTAQVEATDGSVLPPSTTAEALPLREAPAVPIASSSDVPRLAIRSPSLAGSINLVGGRIDDLLLTNYRRTTKRDSPPVRLFAPRGSEKAYYADVGWVGGANGPRLPDGTTLWQATGGPLAPGSPVTLTYDNGEGLSFERRIAVDEYYLFTITQTVRNNGRTPVTLYPYGRVNRHGVPNNLQNFFILHEGMIGVFGEEGLEEIDYDDLDDEKQVDAPAVTRGWLGITDKYWAATVIPRGDSSFTGHFVRGQAGTVPTYQADYLGSATEIRPGADVSNEVLIFAGAKVSELLDRYEKEQDIERFELLIDWGWFYFITKPFFVVIDWLYGLLGNFGLAILAITVIVKIIFFPLANKSYASMAKMKTVQPEVMEIRERHTDDPQAMRVAMMELYKTKKINPVSGCWPVLLQIPIFFSLYKVLFVTIEMRHAPFFGWINDLSAPDPTSLFNLFGLLPYDVPAFLTIGVWPLIMGVTMFIQMRLNPTPPDKMQAMVFNWMPVVFTFMLASFPAGLVIYWAWNNFLSILQQSVIMKRHGAKIALVDNIKELFGAKPKDEPAE